MTVELTPWKRFGHDRLYVTVDDRKVGYRDLATGKDHPEDPGDGALLAAAIDGGLGETGSTSAVVEPNVPVATPRPVEETWSDLATNLPGQAAREQAKEEWRTRREEKPVRAVLGRLLNVHTDERAWRIGADGEEAVGAQLEKLARKDPRWRVLHAVPVGDRGSDIDHLAIGPAGVFTINTKHHPRAKIWVGKDQLRVNGHVQPYIRNSRFEARRAAQLLSAACGFDVRADALLVFFAVEEITVKTAPGEKEGSSVHVKYRRQAMRWLRKQPTALTDEQIEKIYEQARRSSTWT
ncbi:NERD domain-containing protein [Nocardioides sp. Y6]|uniref:NERD domain-containing protein n=1 Tax=Nocardioides malaquae TaxID=2773426 RepID=A0ABR9RV58_9ACTN|nr:nuclease-related domain-containing protein [Nocardioides malaquae]MBE7325250.1 NERD domain-containing protein [Nocardioides malaquae]